MSHLGFDASESPAESAPAKRGPGCLPALVALALLVGAGLLMYVKGVDFLRDAWPESGPDDYAGVGHGSVIVEVKEGESASDIAATLATADVVKEAGAFIEAATADERSRNIQVGWYELNKQMSGDEALKLLLNPKSKSTKLLTIPEGLRANEILMRIVEETDFTSREVQRAYDDASKLGLPPYAEGDPEGYLFPATYDVNPTLNAAGLLKLMVDQFKARAEEVGLVAGAQELGVSPGEVVTIASLVQGEASRPKDMPGVASVVYNRLDQGMALQLDSTLHYAVQSRGEIATSNELREIDSPYNTYQLTGLPPTAIDSPGVDALEAALNPAETDYLYFVTVNLKTGETRFAEDYSEHLGNVDLLNEYCTTSEAC
ncbi:MAG: endolytic transglycosylase MltG [Nocardioidaceae bacterium]